MTVRRQQMRISELTHDLKKAKQSKSQKSATRKGVTEEEKQVASYAKMFEIMHEPFILPSVFAACPTAITSLSLT